MKSLLSLSTLALCAALVATDANAQWSYSSTTATGTCTDIPADLSAGFTMTPIISRAKFPGGNAVSDTIPARPMRMAIDTSGGKIDIYFTEKFGKIRHYRANFDGSDSSLRTVGTIPNVNRVFQEDGLWGIALDPNFKTNGNIFVLHAYAPSVTSGTTGAAGPKHGADTVGWRLMRYTLTGTPKTLDLASAKVVMHVPAGVGERWHTGGTLRFDHYGNLYVGMGDNEGLYMTSGNTADLRGAILRIKPNAAGGYTIPAGNFGPYWAQQFTAQGRTGLAAQYLDTTKVRRELYVKGSRNPYTFGIDPYREGWLSWSECGPDAQRNEEHNFTTKPAFSGWPFWAGYSTTGGSGGTAANTGGVRQTAKAGSYNEPGEPDATPWPTYNPATMLISNPVNTWPGSGGITRNGVDSLPPMHMPTYSYTSPTCAQGGPIIRYDARSNVPGKMPPHLDNVMLYTDFAANASGTGAANNMWAFKLNPATGTTVSSTAQVVFPVSSVTRSTTVPHLNRPIDFMQGPDGALYYLNHGAGCCDGNSGGQSATAGIVRITYTGTNCQDPALIPVSIASKQLTREESASWLFVGTKMFQVTSQGSHEATILDVNGRVLFNFRGEGPQNYNIPELGAKGVHVLRVKTQHGVAVRPLLGY